MLTNKQHLFYALTSNSSNLYIKPVCIYRLLTVNKITNQLQQITFLPEFRIQLFNCDCLINSQHGYGAENTLFF